MCWIFKRGSIICSRSRVAKVPAVGLYRSCTSCRSSTVETDNTALAGRCRYKRSNRCSINGKDCIACLWLQTRSRGIISYTNQLVSKSSRHSCWYSNSCCISCTHKWWLCCTIDGIIKCVRSSSASTGKCYYRRSCINTNWGTSTDCSSRRRIYSDHSSWLSCKCLAAWIGPTHRNRNNWISKCTWCSRRCRNCNSIIGTRCTYCLRSSTIYIVCKSIRRSSVWSRKGQYRHWSILTNSGCSGYRSRRKWIYSYSGWLPGNGWGSTKCSPGILDTCKVICCSTNSTSRNRETNCGSGTSCSCNLSSTPVYIICKCIWGSSACTGKCNYLVRRTSTYYSRTCSGRCR